MVYIKRIDLRGFKTFGKKVSISLDRGLTVITGANGSGKSNVMDCVKFTLGELSAKELRGGSLADLISKTGETHTRSAYAAIQFDNSDRRIPVDSELVTVSREFVRGGEGVYRVNGRRIPRKQVTEILSSAGVEVSGFNIVPQHAVTRLAEFTPEERRKIVEDMIGIAVYDTKKTEAEVQLQQADLNLKVASAKVDEVRSRVESLERERNNFVRYTFLKNQVCLLRALILSDKIGAFDSEVLKIKELFSSKQTELESVRHERDRSSEERARIEDERQKFEQEAVDQGTTRMFELERSIGDRNTETAKLRMELSSNETNLKRLADEKEQLRKRIEEVTKSIEEQNNELVGLRESRDNVSSVLSEKKRIESELWNGVKEAAKSVDVFNNELNQLENSINQLSSQQAKLDGKADAGSVKLELISSHLKTLENRKSEYEQLIGEVEKRSVDLMNLHLEEQKRLEEMSRKIREYGKLKEVKLNDVHRSKETLEKASVTTLEFEAQKNVVENFGSEEKALQTIEEMGQAGAISGIVGRLDKLINVSKDYHRALEAASAGWMKALIVKDVESALSCIESLKRTKMGRIKIIPLRSISPTPTISWSKEAPGIVGPIADLVEVPPTLKPAVNFIFGDTLLANSQKAAYITAAKGVRAVSVSGEVYEPTGGIEGGYYREPFNFETLIKKTLDVENLEKIIRSLETLIAKSEEDAKRIQTEMDSLSESKVQSEGTIAEIEGEMSSVKASLQRAKGTLSNILKRIGDISAEADSEKNQNTLEAEQREKIRKELDQLVGKRDSLRSLIDPELLSQSQQKHVDLSKETGELQSKFMEISSRIGMLESSIRVLEPGLLQMRSRISEIDMQTVAIADTIQQTRRTFEESSEILSKLEGERSSISDKLSTVRGMRDDFRAKLKSIEVETKTLFEKYEQLSTEVNQANAVLKEKEIQISYLVKELQDLGYKEALQSTQEDVKEAQSALDIIKRELDEIGAVNQLALDSYEEQKNIYKQLSTRINELSEEKLSILSFMNELDRKKYNTFMTAFTNVNENFQDIFTKISNGGSGRLLLENSEDPFKGGVDVYLRFPGKAELPISSASGGEKSVATVCFVIALQSIHPMPFYMFDEIDAHLDVLNTQRLADLLKERARGSQFIVISLRDITISRADRIYGIYIQNGVSHAVTLPMPEAKA